MQKLLHLSPTSLFVGGVSRFAQTNESGQKLRMKVAGLRAKNYKEALPSGAHLKLIIDPKMMQMAGNVSVCATKLKDYANAEKYFGYVYQE